jgi:hypothetical protein
MIHIYIYTYIYIHTLYIYVYIYTLFHTPIDIVNEVMVIFMGQMMINIDRPWRTHDMAHLDHAEMGIFPPQFQFQVSRLQRSGWKITATLAMRSPRVNGRNISPNKENQPILHA